MVLGQKHVPQPELLGAFLQVLNDGRMGVEALLHAATADLLGVDGVGGDAFFLDELLDLLGH